MGAGHKGSSGPVWGSVRHGGLPLAFWLRVEKNCLAARECTSLWQKPVGLFGETGKDLRKAPFGHSRQMNGQMDRHFRPCARALCPCWSAPSLALQGSVSALYFPGKALSCQGRRAAFLCFFVFFALLRHAVSGRAKDLGRIPECKGTQGMAPPSSHQMFLPSAKAFSGHLVPCTAPAGHSPGHMRRPASCQLRYCKRTSKYSSIGASSRGELSA